MSLLPLRHGLFLFSSIVTLIGAFLLTIWSNTFFGISFFLVLLAIISTIMIALVHSNKWIASIWPLIFLLLGLNAHQETLLGAHLLWGTAFSVLFLMIQRRIQNQVTPDFFAATQPALRMFVLLGVIGIAIVIFQSFQAEKITTALLQHIPTQEEILLSAQPEDTPWLQPLQAAFQEAQQDLQNTLLYEGMLPPMVQTIAAQRIALECPQQNSPCAQTIRQQIQQELEAQIATYIASQENQQSLFFPASEKILQDARTALQESIQSLPEKTPLPVIAALIFFVLTLPFLGLISYTLSICGYICFLLFRALKLLHITERSVTQTVYV